MTFTHDLAEFINWYSAARKADGNPLCMPEALEALCAVLVGTIQQPKCSDDLRAALVEAVHQAIDMQCKPSGRGALN